ncbi:MAG: hypothetical protein IK115_00510 [Lachnospiraceae bacterium]|nr:hypothetical protein [Lachnospiraceae bacterium]
MPGIEGIKSALGKGARDRAFIGIDLTDEFSQLSFSLGEEDPRTPSLVQGKERLCIPTMLAKKYGESVWTYGEEAVEMVAANEAFPVDRLVERALDGATVEVEAVDYNPRDLLALYIRRCLSRMSPYTPLEKVAAIVISVEDPNEEMIAILNHVVKTLRLKPERVFFQSHAESAYHYIMHQSADVRAADTCVCDLRSTGLKLMIYSQNIQTKPHVVIMQERNYDNFLPEDLAGAKDPELRKAAKDREFYQILYSHIEGRRLQAAFLLGDGFEGDWMKESLKYLCKGRRVFRGNNLFSKGACYGAREKLEPSEEERGNIFLGQDKVKANIGMRVMREGREAYMAILDAGKNWYDTFRECELMLCEEERLEFIVTPLNGKDVKKVPMYLKGLPRRTRRTTRIRLRMEMMSENRVKVVVRDLGFGEIFPSSNSEWEMDFKVS